MKAIVMHIDWPDRYQFFVRMLPELRKRGIKGVFLTNKLAMYKRAKRNGIETELIVGHEIGSQIDLADTREVLGRVLSNTEAQRLYRASQRAIRRVVEREGSIRAVFVWNGSGVVARALKDFCRLSSIEQLYFEISNLPGKLFVDGGGVNAKSWLAEDESILTNFRIDDELFQGWLDHYKREKLASNTIPQAKILDQISFKDTLINWLAFRVGGVPTDDHTSLLSKVMARRKRKIPIELDQPPFFNREFIFFPMQVSDDSQILLNSDVDNAGAIRYAAELARKKKCNLLVKPHPAESSMEEIQRIQMLKKELGFYLVDGNTLDLVQRAVSVVTINSTVGLEAVLLDKHVDFLGRTFYSYFSNRNYLAQYVMGYLADIDYFSDVEMSSRQIDQLLSRLEFNRTYAATYRSNNAGAA